MQAGKTYQGSLIERKSPNCKPFSGPSPIKFTETFRRIAQHQRRPLIRSKAGFSDGRRDSSKLNDGPNTFPLVHQIKGLVDPLQRQRVRDHRIDLDFSAQILLHIIW